MLHQNFPPAAGPAPSRPRTPAPAPAFWGLLPAKLNALPDAVRGQLGPALDRGAVRFVVDSVDGTTLVTRGSRA